MARIFKIRAIPRGYVPAEIAVDDNHTNAEWFMVLYNQCGAPQKGGLWSYLIRHYGIVIRITAITLEGRKCEVWVSPKHVQDAKRKRTKAVNVIARRLNEENIPFYPEEEGLYYPVRMKNAELLSDMTADEALRLTGENLTENEKWIISGPLERFMTDAKGEIDKTIGELFDGE